MYNIPLKYHWWRYKKVQLCALVLLLVFAFVWFNLNRGKSFNSAGINEQLNFQARLLDDTGAVVPDGFYNLRFKVYQDGDGCVVSGSSPCGGTLEWTETRVSTDKVRVKNGYFSVYLGSVTPFGTDVDWNQDSLWLSIDVGGTASPSWDGEMLPFTRFSATPYAKNAKKVGGLSKDELIQLGQASLQVDSTTNGSIGVNKTGATGDILKLQRGGSDVLVLDNAGYLLFKPQTDSVTAVQVKNTAGSSTIFSVDTSNKRVGVNSPAPTASLMVTSSDAGYAGLIVRGAVTQTANLQEWQNDAGSILARVASNGYIYAPGLVSTGTPASSGFVRLANAENIAWRNAANSADYTFGVNGSNQLVSTAPIWVNIDGAILYGRGGSAQARTVLTYNGSNEYLDLSSNGSVKLRLTSSYGAQFGAYSLTGGTNEKLRVNSPVTVDNLANTMITASATTAKPLVIQGLASQTANLQEWQSSTGTVSSAIAADGDIVSTEQISVGNLTPLSGVRMSVYTNTDVKGLVVRGSGSQTANLQEWQNSSGTVLGSVKSDGSLVVGSGNQYLSAANLTVRGAGAVQSAFIQTATSSSTGGSGIIGIQDDGAATSSGDRLGYILLGGAYDASNNAYHSAGITAFASQDFASGSGGSELRFEVMANGSATRTLRVAIPQGLDGFTFGASQDTNLYRSAANTLKTDDNFLVQTASNSTTAFQAQDSSGQVLLTVDTTARGVSGGNLVKIGNSTGTDADTTILQLDGTTADPTSNLSALNGGLFYNSTSNKVSIVENGVVKVLCNTTDAGCGAGGSGARLDQVTAATSGASINNAANNVVWNWQLSAAESGFTFTENVASTGGGTQDQFITDMATLTGSTASPLRVTSASVDAADIVFNLASAGDIEFQDNGTAFMTLSDAGAYTYTLDATDNPAYTITNNGSGNVVTNLAGTGDLIVQDNGTAVFTIADSGKIDTAFTSTNTTATDDYSLKVTVSDTGIVTTGTDNTYGQQISVARSGATGGTINTFGIDITASSDNAGVGGTSTVRGVSAIAGGNAFGSADYMYGVAGAALAVAGNDVTKAVGVSGSVGSVFFGGTIVDAYALEGSINMTGGGTITTTAGLQINSAAISGTTIANNYGIRVAAQTVGTTDYGVAIEAADTQTLWLSSNANNTTASAGIAFGSSRDTTLYRKDVAKLATDGTFQVGSTTSAGQIDLYGDLVKKGVSKQTGLTGISDIFVYDTTKDSDAGAWTNSPTSQSLSWYTESKNDGYGDACNIGSDTRCGSSDFPKKAIIVSTTSAVYIFDANDYKMFMKFDQNASGYAIGVDTNNDPSSVFALNGVVYVGANGSAAGGLYAIDFTSDRLFNYNTTDRDQGNKNIANRNTAVTYNVDSRTAMAIRHNAVNAVHGSVLYGSSSVETNGGPLNGATFIAAATDDSMSVINLSAQQTLDYGDNLTDQFSSVYVTKRGRLYGLNVTLSQVERYGTQANGTVGIDVAKADQATPTDVFDEQAANLPHVANGASAPTFAVGAPDALKVMERASMADDAADLIYVGHSAGLTEVHDTNTASGTSIGWSKNYNISRETGYMSGTQRGMFSFDNLSGDLTDATIRNSVLEPEVAPTYGVNGVHGTGLRFNGTSQFLCSDANNDGTCDTDADFNVAATSFHVEAWFKHSATITGTDVLIDKRYSAFAGTEGIGYTVEMNSSGQIVFGIQDTAATAGYDDSVTSTQTYNDNQWHHVVALNTDTGICLYLDGKLAVGCDTTLGATGTLDASQILTIGADASGAAGGNFWDGDIDDVYFAGGGATTSDTLTQVQIRKRYLEGRSALSRPSTVVSAATTSSSTTIGDSGESYVTNAFVGGMVEITAGTGAGQSRRVIANDGTTLTVSPAWTVTPSTDSDYEVIPEKLYGDTSTVTSIALNNTNFLGTNPDLYVGTSNGSDGGAVSVLGGYGNSFISNVYHSNAGVTDSTGTSWSGTDADDIDAFSVESGVVAMGSSANMWFEKSDRNLEQDVDKFFSNISSIRGELIVDGMAAVSSEVGGVGGADLAERFTSFESLTAGEIVSSEDNNVGVVRRTSQPYDDKTLGIVATQPGIVIGPQEDDSYPIALSGRVPVKVALKPGEKIKSGDRITSSSIPGHGMKAVTAGRVVGVALEDVNPDTLIACPDGSPEGMRCGTITVFVNLVDYNGQKVEVALEEFQDAGFVLPDSVLGPLLNLQEGVLDEKLQKSDEIIRYLLGRKQQQAATDEAQSEILTDRISALEVNGLSIIAKDITADTIKANKIEGLEILVGKLTGKPVKTSSGSTDSSVTTEAINMDNFVVKTATVSKDLNIDGVLFANGALEVAGPVKFLGTSIFYRLATFVDSVIFQSDVEIEGRLTQNNDAAGFATIYKTQKKVKIEFDKPYEDTPVVTVNIKNGKFAQFAYDDLTKDGFTIILPEIATEDIEFAWTAVSVKDAKTVDVPLPPSQQD